MPRSIIKSVVIIPAMCCIYVEVEYWLKNNKDVTEEQLEADILETHSVLESMAKVYSVDRSSNYISFS